MGSYWPWLRPRAEDKPDIAPDLCFQLIRSVPFRSASLDIPRNSAQHAPYLWDYAKRCFIFTDQGLTHLDQTQRTQIAPKHPDIEPDDPRNNPPVAQCYLGSRQEAPDATYCSPTRHVHPVIGAESIDGKYLVAVAGDSPEFLYQGWMDCVHN